MTDRATRPQRPGRADSREAAELRSLKSRHPELGDAVDMHLELLDMHKRIQSRVPLPAFEMSAEDFTAHRSAARPLLRFEQIPLDVTELRLAVRQTADILRRFGALDEADYQSVQALGRQAALAERMAEWYHAGAAKHLAASGAPGRVAPAQQESSAFDQVVAEAMRPFLARCAEVIQQRPELAAWLHPHCAMCGAEPDFSVITPSAERHLICSRCGLRWKFEALTCPFCRNGDRSRITSFATPDGQYRVYACDVCTRYLKAYDGRRATRPVMPVVDGVATLPLDAAAMQRGYTG